MSSIKPLDALATLDSVATKYHGTRADHDILRASTEVIQAALVDLEKMKQAVMKANSDLATIQAELVESRRHVETMRVNLTARVDRVRQLEGEQKKGAKRGSKKADG